MKTASTVFRGFPAEGVAFLRDLKIHNDREWFTPRLEVWKEVVQAPMIQLVSAIHHAMLGFAPEYVGEPAKCIYRVYRDIRFSKDKTPYKPRADALMWHRSFEKNAGAAFFISISPDEVGIAGGLYGPATTGLLAVREAIAENPRDFRATFETKTVRKLMGELKGTQAVRIPRGFRADDAAADLLRYRQFLLYNTLDPAIITTPRLLREIVTRMEAMTPFVRFLNAPLLPKPRG